MRLRPAQVDRMTHPLARAVGAAFLFQPEQPVVVPHPVDDVRRSVAVDVIDQHGNAHVAGQLELLVNDPLARPPIRRRFHPTHAGDEIAAAVAVEIAKAQALAHERLVVGGVFDELAQAFARGVAFEFVPGHCPAGRIGNERRLAITGHVPQACRLDESRIDQVFLPFAAGLAGVLVPEHLPAEEPARDDVGVAVAVDVQHQVGEVVEVLQLVLDLAERMFLPVAAGICRSARTSFRRRPRSSGRCG